MMSFVWEARFKNLIRERQKRENAFLLFEMIKVITIWYVTKRKKYKSTVFQILASVKKIIHATRMLDAKTPLDHMYVNVTLDILEMDRTAQANLISLQQYLD